jgi:hypothetical protein
LVVSELSESSSFLQCLCVCKFSLEIVDWVEILASLTIGTRACFMELYT